MADYIPQYPPAHSTTYVKATSVYNATYYSAHFGTDPGLPLTGTWHYNEWKSANFLATYEQKFNVDLGSAKTITRIRLDNAHESGANTNRGIKNFSVYGSNSSTAFDNTTYSDTTDLTLLDSFTAAEHAAADTADPQYFVLGTTGSFRYYILRIADAYITYANAGFRHIEFEATVPIVGDLDINSVGIGGIASGFGGVTLSPVVAEGDGGATGGITLGGLSASGEGEVGSLLEVTGQLFQLQGGISLNTESVAELSGKLFELKGGFQIDEIELTGQLFELKGGFSIERSIEAELSGKLFELQGGIDVVVDALVELGGQLFELQGGMDAETSIPFELGGQLFELKGTMTAVAEEPEVELSGQLFELKGGFTFAGAGECSGVLSYSPGASC